MKSAELKSVNCPWYTSYYAQTNPKRPSYKRAWGSPCHPEVYLVLSYQCCHTLTLRARVDPDGPIVTKTVVSPLHSPHSVVPRACLLSLPHRLLLSASSPAATSGWRVLSHVPPCLRFCARSHIAAPIDLHLPWNITNRGRGSASRRSTVSRCSYYVPTLPSPRRRRLCLHPFPLLSFRGLLFASAVSQFVGPGGISWPAAPTGRCALKP